MNNLLQIENFEILEKHKERGVKLLRWTEDLDIKILINDENIILSDFQQGEIGNCGLIAACAALSQRPEFLTEIVPIIVQTSEGKKLCFKMFYEEMEVPVIVDDALPIDYNIDNFSMIYACSARNENLYLASLFEKAFVKQVCNNSYEFTEGTRPLFVFSSFSRCMTCYRHWRKEESKKILGIT